MESRFRVAFPDAVAVVDPVLQMRCKLVAVRYAVGQFDSGDFLLLIENVAVVVKELSAGSLRIVFYESGRLTFELVAIEAAVVRCMVARLLQAGLSVDTASVAKRAGSGTVVMIVRAL